MNTNNSFKSFQPHDLTEKFDSIANDILKNNEKFYLDTNNIDILLKIINHESGGFIRIVDWFVERYAEKNNTNYVIELNGEQKTFFVYNEYKQQFNDNNQLYFDPFCRKRKIDYLLMNTKNGEVDIVFTTSIGQLNFFQWAIKNKVIDYVYDHLDEIRTDMQSNWRLNRATYSI